MDLTAGMTDEATSHLLVHSGPCQSGDHGDAGAVKAEVQTQSVKDAGPVSGCQSVELPCTGASHVAEPEEQILDRWHQAGGMSSASLQRKGDGVVLEVDVTEGKAGLLQTASLIDGNRPGNLAPVGGGGEGALDDRSFGIGDDGLLGRSITLDPELGGGIAVDPFPIVRLVENLSQDPEVVDGGIPADLSPGEVLVTLSHAPVHVLEAVIPGHIGGGSNSMEIEEGGEIFPSSGIALEGAVVLVEAIEPSLNPLVEGSDIPSGSRSADLDNFLGGPDLTGITGLLNTVPATSGGLLNLPTSVIEVPNPPVRTADPLV